MKVAVITRHAITNYGSLLQAYATQKVIESMGHSCNIIDYVRSDESMINREITLLKRKPKWNNNLFLKVSYLALRLPNSIASGIIFNKERRRLLNLTKTYDSYSDIEMNPPIADLFVTGSDQVWGPVENGEYDETYFLKFVGGKKVSFASSFGRTDFNNSRKDFFYNLLKEYSNITVREESAKEIITSLGLNATQVIDPTLMFDTQFWSELIEPIKKKKYILVYQLHNDKKLGKFAHKISKEMNLPIIRISPSFHQIFRPGRFVWCPSVGKFLSYIKNAELMITDSFHGTAFAINFNTQFVEFLPNNNTGTRNISILKLTGLSNRILTSEDDNSLENIDYTIVNKIIKELRDDSWKCVRTILEVE